MGTSEVTLKQDYTYKKTLTGIKNVSQELTDCTDYETPPVCHVSSVNFKNALWISFGRLDDHYSWRKSTRLILGPY